MKVCFVAPSAFGVLSPESGSGSVGGAEVQQVLVATALARAGIDVSMICMDHGQSDGIQINGVRVFKSHKPTVGIPVIRFLHPRLTSMWGAMSRANADIYYQRTAGMLTGVVALFCKRRGRRSIFAGAGNPDFCSSTPRIRHVRDRKLYEYGLRNVDQLLFQNEEQRKLCIENYGRDGRIIGNFYCPPKRHSRQLDGYVLWVSTMRTLKRPEFFLKLAKALPDIQFKMVGGPSAGEKAYYERIETEAKRISNLQFLGFVPYCDVEQHFDNACLFVNTSESEGFPNTFPQAWARRIPTISFVDSGARLREEPVGIVVSNFSNMLSEISSLIADRAKLNWYGDFCFEFFSKNNSTEMLIELYIDVFRSLMTK